MKKNGFTLVELIATIVVLAIVISVSVPLVNETLKNAKVDIFENNEENLEEAALNYYTIHYNLLPDTNDQKTITLEELVQNGFIDPLNVPGKVDVFCSGDSFVRVSSLGVDEYSYSAYLDCGEFVSDVDLVAPSLTLNGDELVLHTKGSAYTDLGAEATYETYEVNNLGFVNGTIYATSDSMDLFDSNTSGIYELSYAAEDNYGNTSTLKRTVIVYDSLDEPLIDIASLNSGVKKSHSMDITIAGNTLSSVYYQWTTSSSSPEEDDVNWALFSYTEGSRDTLIKSTGDGEYYLHIKATDILSNVAIETSEAVVLDNTLPVITTEIDTSSFEDSHIITVGIDDDNLNKKYYQYSTSNSSSLGISDPNWVEFGYEYASSGCGHAYCYEFENDSDSGTIYLHIITRDEALNYGEGVSAAINLN